MNYTLNEDEDYRDFFHRTLKGQINQNEQKIILFLLEIIISEIGSTTYSISLAVKTKEIAFNIVHHDKAIKDNIISIIDNLVDFLRYRHLTKNSHKLIMRINRTKAQRSNYIIIKKL